MIPEEILLNAAENISENNAKITELVAKTTQLKYFGNKMLADLTSKAYDSVDTALSEAFSTFYDDEATASDILSFQLESGASYVLFRNLSDTSSLIEFDCGKNKFYLVTKSDDSYTYTDLFTSPTEVTEEITTAINDLDTILRALITAEVDTLNTKINAEVETLNETIDTKENEIYEYVDTQDTANKTFTTEQFNNAVAHAESLFNQVNTKINTMLDGADETLDTFKEIYDQVTQFKEEHQDFLDAIAKLTTTIKTDSDTTVVALDLVDNTDYSYTADNISSITINIPSSIEHGFACGINFKTGSSYPAFTINNKSSFDLKKIVNGVVFDSVTLKANQLYNCICLCNGMGIIFQLLEMDK